MDENGKRIQREIAKDKIQIILASIAVAVLIIMELYIMINYKSNFMGMAAGILLMIIALFFLISGVLDMSLKSKDMEEQKYEDIYNAQKASYLVIRKSFDELDQRLRAIEENSSLPAEDIINAQKAVAKVTISRSKENTDALMNSNDELINQMIAIQEKLENNNNSIIEKQQSLLKETNFDIQQKIAEITSQLSSLEGRIQGQMSAIAAQPVQVVVPPVVTEVASESANAPEMPVMEQTPVTEEMPVMEEASMAEEMPTMDEAPAAEEMPMMDEVPAAEEMPMMEEAPAAEEMPVMEETSVDDLGLDLDAIVEEDVPAEEPVIEETASDDVGLDLDAMVEEEPVADEAPVDDLGLDLDAATDEGAVEDLGLDLDTAVEEAPADDLIEIPDGEPVVEEAVEIAAEEPVAEEVAEMPAEEPAAEEVVEIAAEEPVADEVVEIAAEEPAAEEVVEIAASEPALEEAPDLDALLAEVGGPVDEEPAPEPEPEPPKEEESDDVVIPDVGVDLSDPNRVMSAEEIEKLFASI